MGVRRTTFQITVLRPDETIELTRQQLEYELSDDGDWLEGPFESVTDEILADAEVAEAEIAFGSDGTYFASLGYLDPPSAPGGGETA